MKVEHPNRNEIRCTNYSGLVPVDKKDQSGIITAVVPPNMETSQTTVLKLSTRNNKYQKPLNTMGMFANMLKGEGFLPFLCEK